MVFSDKSVFYIGSLNPNSNSFKRYNYLRSLVGHVDAIDIDDYIYNSRLSSLYHRFNFGPGIYNLNRVVLETCQQNKYDLLLIDNKPYLTSTTLRKLKSRYGKLCLTNLVTDDPNGRYRSHWGLSRRTARYYDWIFVQRPENLEEYREWGARNVGLCLRSFDPEFHKPLNLDKEDVIRLNTSVGFIGTYEEEREEYIAYLIDSGVPVRVTGDGWPGKRYWSVIKPYYMGPSVYGVEYVKRINGMELALHFLRKGNRDQQDSRSFEIPACGTFMLAEYSPIHADLFLENVEAVFFRDKEELLQKAKYFLDNAQARESIARNGLNRCHRDGYDHISRLKNVLNQVFDFD